MVSIDELKEIRGLYKKPKFKIKNNIIRIDEFLNSYGNYIAFLNDIEYGEENNLYILKKLYEVSDKEFKFCLVGKIGYKNMFFKYVAWLWKYFKMRKDLDFIRRVYITFKKSHKYLYRYNYNTCIDVQEYFSNQTYYNQKILEMFLENKIDRLNLYRYVIEETL